ncbi:MAG: OadG family protein [Bacillota bacterium]|jgi:sodium pump decarboxylase gamma subunit
MFEFMEVGIMTTIIGIGVVFIVLIVLSFMIRWLNFGVEAVVGKKPKQEEPEKVPIRPEKSTGVLEPKSAESISPAVVAAITASICALTGKSAEEFHFTAIRRVSGMKPMWSLMGTQDIISTRQRFIERGNR